MYDNENYRYITDEIIELTPLENKMLRLLIKNKGKVMTYKQIIKEVYFEMYNKEDMRQRMKIRRCIQRLRKKLKDEVEFINKRSVGYMIEKFEERCNNEKNWL